MGIIKKQEKRVNNMKKSTYDQLTIIKMIVDIICI